MARRSLRQTEIEEDNLPFRRELQILRLDIAMDDGRLLCVQVIQSVQQLVRPIQDLRDGKRCPTLFQLLKEVFAWNELHHEKLALLVREVVADARQGRM